MARRETDSKQEHHQVQQQQQQHREQQEKQQQQQQVPPHFDRLKPRGGVKRKASTGVEELAINDQELRARKLEFKEEYTKLKRLVPALNQRSDITRVEIIEETIRYIDALHHQLSTRMQATAAGPSAALSGSDASVINAAVNDKPTVKHSAAGAKQPLQALISADSTSVSLNQRPSSSSQDYSGSNDPPAGSTSEESSSTKDLMVAVENIQKMFCAHLLNQQRHDDWRPSSDNGGDETDVSHNDQGGSS